MSLLSEWAVRVCPGKVLRMVGPPTPLGISPGGQTITKKEGYPEDFYIKGRPRPRGIINKIL